MPLKQFFALALAAIGLVLSSGCESATTLPPPKSSTTLILAPKNRQVLTTLRLHGELKVILPRTQGGPAYTWAIVSANTAVLPQSSPLKPTPNPTDDEAFEVTFQSIRGGRSTIRFAAVKADQAEQEPEDLYQVAVGVKQDE
jgi:hypothetical protein